MTDIWRVGVLDRVGLAVALLAAVALVLRAWTQIVMIAGDAGASWARPIDALTAVVVGALAIFVAAPAGRYLRQRYRVRGHE